MTPLASASPRRQLSMASAPSSPTQKGTTFYLSLPGSILCSKSLSWRPLTKGTHSSTWSQPFRRLEASSPQQNSWASSSPSGMRPASITNWRSWRQRILRREAVKVQSRKVLRWYRSQRLSSSLMSSWKMRRYVKGHLIWSKYSAMKAFSKLLQSARSRGLWSRVWKRR